MIIILLNPVIAKTIEEEIYERESFEVAGKNITLLVIGDGEKSAVACINNERYILEKSVRKYIGDVRIEPLRIYRNYIKLEITYPKEDICDKSCSNNECMGLPPLSNEDPQENTNIEQQETQPQENQQEGIGINTLSIVLFVIVVLLLLILLFKKKR